MIQLYKHKYHYDQFCIERGNKYICVSSQDISIRNRIPMYNIDGKLQLSASAKPTHYIFLKEYKNLRSLRKYVKRDFPGVLYMKKYKMEYWQIPYTNTIFYIIATRRFKIWWPLETRKKTKFGVITISDITREPIEEFTKCQSIFDIRNRPIWYWIEADTRSIKTFEFNDFSEIKSEFAEYLI